MKDYKFEINGGQVIALGSDMLQKPDVSSKQKYITFSLNSKISNGSNISLKDSKGNELISFEAKEDFTTLIVSKTNLANDTYDIYINNEKTEYSYNVK